MSRKPSRRRRLNATAGSLLGFLHEGPQSGWDLVATAALRIGEFWSLTQSQVYRELATMAADGLIEADEVGPRDRRAYRLTPAGRAAFAEWLSQPPGPEQIRYPLLLTMSFAQHLDADQLAGFVAEHRRIHATRLASYTQAKAAAVAAEVPAVDLVTLDFGLRYERAVLDWLDHLPAGNWTR